MPGFIPGLHLSELYYWQAVRPILDAHFPALPHSAALIGDGSDVMGFDTDVSRDHEWGPRLIIFVKSEDDETTSPLIHDTLRYKLPVQFMGYSTHFSSPDLADGGVRIRTNIAHGPVDHHIYFTTITKFLQNALGIVSHEEIDPADWLTFSEQALLSVTGGRVFHDDLGIEDARRRFAYYPHDVWLYMLAAQWGLISQEEAFVGRAASTGDALGSRIIAARLAERLVHLCLLMEKRYAPYSKWLGTAFKQLSCYPHMGPLLEGAAAAITYQEREHYLARAYTLAAEMHNALEITPPFETRTRTYSGWHQLRAGVSDLPYDDARNTRPFQCIFAERFSEAILATVRDPAVRAFSPNKGSVSQFFVESSGAVQDQAFCRNLKDDLTK